MNNVYIVIIWAKEYSYILTTNKHFLDAKEGETLIGPFADEESARKLQNVLFICPPVKHGLERKEVK